MRGLAGVLCLLFITAPCFPSALPERISLSVGETAVLAADIKRAALGSGKVVSLATPERGQVLLLAEAAGATTAELWLTDGTRHRLEIEVRQRDLSARLAEVQALLSGAPSIAARNSGRFILLEGGRVSAEEQGRAAEVAALFPGEVLNFVGRAEWESMVELQVRLVEVRRDHLRRLGIRWDTEAQGPGVGASAGAAAGGLSFQASLATQLGSRIDLLQQKGLAYTFAEPTLSCRSGGSARFVSGGEVPIPVTDGLGSTDVEYKEYGVILEIRPRAHQDGGVYAELDIEVSQIDAAVRVGDYPGFLKRRTSTAINVQEGQTIAIAGMVSRERGRDHAGTPGLSSLPMVGALFQSKRRMERETELVVLITPRRIDTMQVDNPASRQPQLIERFEALQGEGGVR